MRILVLAPQPFYQERGTPIAVRLAVETLSKKLLQQSSQEKPIDLLVYNEGSDIEIPGVRIIRVRTLKWLSGIRPGISLKKLACDLFFTWSVFQLIRNAKGSQYDVIHAVEESVFIAWVVKKLFGIPYVYDMDSSLALQVTEKWWWCKPVLVLFQYLEGLAIRGSVSVAPVCDALQAIATRHGSTSTVMLRDISLLPSHEPGTEDRSAIFGTRLPHNAQIILYVGNLESYQGIDLLLESFAEVSPSEPLARLIIVGGNDTTIEKYRAKAERLGCSANVIFSGPRPVRDLAKLLGSADILVSPRIKGNNTPMKIYSYLHSGSALLATDLPTHQQVLNESIAVLTRPDPASFASGMRTLLRDDTLRTQLGNTARETAERLYTVEAFESQISKLYNDVAARLGKSAIVEELKALNQ